MTSQASSDVGGGTPLRELLAAPDDVLPPAVASMWALAAEAQTQRHQDGAAATGLVSRSTALWAVLVADSEVALALAEGNLEGRRLRVDLHITVDPNRVRRDSPEVSLAPSLAAALEDYLGSPDAVTSLDLPGIADALLRSCERPGGRLPGRLRRAGADVPAAVDALGRLRNGQGVYGFSRTVQSVRSSLGPDEMVSAGRLAAALATRHRDYGGGRLIDATLDLQGPARVTDDWLQLVRECYDAMEVLESSRGILDGELTIRALADLDPGLGRNLEEDPDLKAWLRSVRPEPRVARGTRPSSDVPADRDLLGRDTLAVTIIQQLDLLGSRDQSSLLIHLDGQWGYGKSTVLRFLRNVAAATPAPTSPHGALSKRQGAADDDGVYAGVPRYLVVEVNAWREQRVGAQWWTLYRALRRAHHEAATTRWSRLRLSLAHGRDVVVVRSDKVWPPVLTVLLAVVLGLVARYQFTGALDVTEILSVVALLFASLTAVYRLLAPASPRAARALVETSTNPMIEVRELFTRSLDRSMRPVLFLIDDLDRCEVDYVVRFLEVVQTLVRDARGDVARNGPHAVVAADGKWLRMCYEEHFAQLRRDDVPGKPLGYHFLEKIFQMHIRLPAVEDEKRQRYFETLLFPDGSQRNLPTAEKSAEDAARAVAIRSRIREVASTRDLSDLTPEMAEVKDIGLRDELRAEAVHKAASPDVAANRLHELTPFGLLLDSNPRTIKLFVNAVSMQTYLRLLEGTAVEISSLALWAVLEARWPALADHLRDHPEDVVAPRPQGGEPGALSPELAALLESRDVAPVLRSDRWGVFTPERVRACTGLSGS